MKLLKEVKARLKLQMMSGFEDFVDVNIPEIPTEWEIFPNSEDEWIKVPMPNSENSSACLYKAKEGSLFKPHKHETVSEHLVVMNEGGLIKLITEKEIKIIEYPNSCIIPKGQVHAVEFITDTVIMVVWHPMFEEGWSASFKNEK